MFKTSPLSSAHTKQPHAKLWAVLPFAFLKLLERNDNDLHFSHFSPEFSFRPWLPWHVCGWQARLGRKLGHLLQLALDLLCFYFFLDASLSFATSFSWLLFSCFNASPEKFRKTNSMSFRWRLFQLMSQFIRSISILHLHMCIHGLRLCLNCIWIYLRMRRAHSWNACTHVILHSLNLQT